MRYCCLLILSLFLLTTKPVAQQATIDSIITETSVKQLVEWLAADSLMGRFTGSKGQEQAADFIAREFRKAGLAPIAGYNGYFMPFSFPGPGQIRESKNVVGVLPGNSKSSELILISAHYDHIGTLSTNPAKYVPENGRPEKGDTIYNGANDNASGISAVISMARYFGRINNNERTLVFIAFSGEELGLIGSREMARTMDIQYVKAMINMDMIGVPAKKKNRYAYFTGSPLSNLRDILNNELYNINPQQYGKQFFKRDPFLTEHLFTRSDNYWFALRGVAAHSILATPPNNRYYHSLNDEAGTLDYNLLATITKAIALSITGLVNGTQTPSKLDIERINSF